MSLRALGGMGFALFLAGCSIFQPWFPSSGASKSQIIEQQEDDLSIPVIDATGAVAQRLQAAQERSLFSETLGDEVPVGHIVGRQGVQQPFAARR